MKNQDMPASPATRLETKKTENFGALSCEVTYSGETKYEKAFWMMFSSMASAFPSSEIDEIAKGAIEATDAGFKALEAKD